VSQEPIAIDGIVVDAVRSIYGARSVATDGIILETVEYLRNTSFGTDAENPLYGSEPYNVRGISSFSLKLTSGGANGVVSLETFVRDGVLVIVLNQLESATSQAILEWKVQQANGYPLPTWLSFVGNKVLMGERAADAEVLNLRVIGILENGETVTHEVRIDPVSGEVQPLRIGRSGSIAPLPFWQQIQAEPALTESQRSNLGGKVGAR
jgi:hypothetical protein